MAEKLRSILDTSVLVAGLRSQLGASAALLLEVAGARVQVIASPALFLEYETVLRREHHGLDALAVEGVLNELANLIEPVEIHFVWRPLLTDPGDELVIEAAINGHADAIVTHNRRDFTPAAGKFGLQVLSPAEVLELLRRKEATK